MHFGSRRDITARDNVPPVTGSRNSRELLELDAPDIDHWLLSSPRRKHFSILPIYPGRKISRTDAKNRTQYGIYDGDNTVVQLSIVPAHSVTPVTTSAIFIPRICVVYRAMPLLHTLSLREQDVPILSFRETRGVLGFEPEITDRIRARARERAWSRAIIDHGV